MTGDKYLNSIAVPLLLVKSARVGACDFDIRQILTATFVWNIPSPHTDSAILSNLAGGWQLGSIITATTGAPFTATIGEASTFRSGREFAAFLGLVNVVVVALANKMARTIWALLAHARTYQPGYAVQAA